MFRNSGATFTARVVTFGLHKPADVAAQNIESRGLGGFGVRHRGRRATRCAARCRCWASTTSTTRWRGLRSGLQYGVPLEAAAAVAGHAYQLVTSAEKSCRSAAPRSSTIATIRIRRPWTAWCARWRRFQAQRRIVVAGEMLELGPVGRSHASRVRAGTWRSTESIVLLGVRGLAKAMVEGATRGGRAARSSWTLRRKRASG